MSSFFLRQFRNIFGIFLAGALVVAGMIFWISFSVKNEASRNEESSISSSCPVFLEKKTVRGTSMDPVFRSGDTIRVWMGWYVCHDPERGDDVLARFAGNDAPLLKKIFGIPGDIFAIRFLENGEGELLVNGSCLVNSRGDPYHFPPTRATLWRSYEEQLSGKIPADSFLILGEIETGSLDSSRFGFVARDDLLGKVIGSSTP